MKPCKFVYLLSLTLLLARGAYAEVTPEQVLEAVDKMTPEQVLALSQKLESKVWKPIPEGFFTRAAFDIGVSGSSLDKVDLKSVPLSGGKLTVDEIDGLDLGLLWRIGGEHFRLGLRMSAWDTYDSNLGEGGYSRVEISGGSVALAANVQAIRTDKFLLWAEVAPGGSWVAIDTVDTPSGQATTLRQLDASFGQVDVTAGASWRMNRILSFSASGGYRFAESVTLEEGGQKIDARLDASGYLGRIALGFNF